MRQLRATTNNLALQSRKTSTQLVGQAKEVDLQAELHSSSTVSVT